VTGYAETVVNQPPVDSAPFNHPTKIVVIKVKHKARAADKANKEAK
jgi:23S rRNA (cytosine1962-C5)-methyltransferase